MAMGSRKDAPIEKKRRRSGSINWSWNTTGPVLMQLDGPSESSLAERDDTLVVSAGWGGEQVSLHEKFSVDIGWFESVTLGKNGFCLSCSESTSLIKLPLWDSDDATLLRRHIICRVGKQQQSVLPRGSDGSVIQIKKALLWVYGNSYLPGFFNCSKSLESWADFLSRVTCFSSLP